MLDEIHTFFIDNEMHYQQHFSQERTILQEQEKQNARLEQLIQTAQEKLKYIQSQSASQQAEKDQL